MTAFEIYDAEFEYLLPKFIIEGLLQKPILLSKLTSTISNTYHQDMIRDCVNLS
jgi:hypothetical protein